jgi:hypothetical protein
MALKRLKSYRVIFVDLWGAFQAGELKMVQIKMRVAKTAKSLLNFLMSKFPSFEEFIISLV